MVDTFNHSIEFLLNGIILPFVRYPAAQEGVRKSVIHCRLLPALQIYRYSPELFFSAVWGAVKKILSAVRLVRSKIFLMVSVTWRTIFYSCSSMIDLCYIIA